MQDEPLLLEDVIDEQTPPVEPAKDGWTATETRQPLLPAALLGIAVLLAWRFIGARLLRDDALQLHALRLRGRTERRLLLGGRRGARPQTSYEQEHPSLLVKDLNIAES